MKRVIVIVLLSYFSNQSNPLSELAEKFQTDKGPKYHNYSKVYHNIFKHLQDKEISFLEIGFYHGASARMWDSYFTNAKKLDFIDINQDSYAYFKDLSSRCSLNMVNQEDESELKLFLDSNKDGYDVIIDDGGHTMNQNITSFKILFPFLKRGGIYVIEDLHTAYWKNYGGLYNMHNLYNEFNQDLKQNGHVTYNVNNTIQFLQDIIHHINYKGARIELADSNKFSDALKSELDPLYSEIESIQFFNSLCIIRKFE